MKQTKIDRILLRLAQNFTHIHDEESINLIINTREALLSEILKCKPEEWKHSKHCMINELWEKRIRELFS